MSPIDKMIEDRCGDPQNMDIETIRAEAVGRACDALIIWKKNRDCATSEARLEAAAERLRSVGWMLPEIEEQPC